MNKSKKIVTSLPYEYKYLIFLSMLNISIMICNTTVNYIKDKKHIDIYDAPTPYNPFKKYKNTQLTAEIT